MTALDWFITCGSFGCFAAAWAWLCIEASRKILSGGSSPEDANSRPTPILSAWRKNGEFEDSLMRRCAGHASNRKSRWPKIGWKGQANQIAGSSPAALNSYEVTNKCPVVTPPAGMGNTASGSRPGRISTGGAEVRKRALAAGKHAEKSAPATHIAGPTDRPARRSIVHWLAFHGGIK